MNPTNKTLQRTVIIGNSGSGKSYFAKKLAEILEIQVVHFDEYFWEPGGLNKKRPIDIVRQEIFMLSKHENWIIEGVFGDIAAIALVNATALIFLDKSWEECESALLSRGSESSKQQDLIAAENNFNELIGWARAYWDRENSCSQTRHQKIFSDFQGSKIVFRNRSDSQKFLEQMLFNPTMLNGLKPSSSSSKCDYFILEENTRNVFIKKLISTQGLWRKLFLNEIQFYNLYSVHDFSLVKIPQLITSDEESGLLALEFIEGQTLANNRFIGKDEISISMINRCMDTAIEISQIECRLNHVTSLASHKNYITNSFEHCYEWGYISSNQKDRLSEQFLSRQIPLAFSHGDFLLRNIIDSENGLFVLDWEFTGENFQYFDLAMLWVQLLKDPKAQLHIYEQAKKRVDWKSVEFILVFLLMKEIRIHKKDDLINEIVLLEECLRNVLQSMDIKDD